MRVVGEKVLVLSCILGLGAVFAQLPVLGQPAPVPEPLSQQVYSNSPPARDMNMAVESPASASMLKSLDIQAASSVKQGEVLEVRIADKHFLVRNATPSNGFATLAGHKAPFFQQPDETFLALVPVSVFQKPGSYPLEIHDPNGPVLKTMNITVQNAHFKTQNVNVSKTTEGLQPLPGELEAIQALKDTITPMKYWGGDFLSPTSDCQNSPFGVLRLHNGMPTGDYHKGVDLRSPMGRPIHAINGGKVQIARMYRLHGGTVGIDHGQGVGSIYIHMSRLAAHPGEIVKKGDVIGYVGSTGFATGPHLHWGMYVSGLPVNPNQWIDGVPICR